MEIKSKINVVISNYIYTFKYKDYRRLFIINLLNSILLAMLVPVFPLWIIRDLGISVGHIFLLLSVIGIIGMALNVLIGHLTDIIGKRKLIIEISLLLGCIRALLFGLFPYIWIILAISWINEIKTHGLIFAILHDKIIKKGHEKEQGLITSTVRAAISFGFIIGPWLGISLITFLTFNQFFMIFAFLYLVLMIIVRFLLVEEESIEKDVGRQKQDSKKSRLQDIWTITSTLIVIVLLFTGSKTNGTLLTLYINELFIAWAIAIVFSIGPIFEMLVFPLVGMLNDKIGTKYTLIMGGIIGTLYFILLAINKSLFFLIIIQIFGTLYTAVLYTSLMMYVQDIYKNRIGFSSSLYFSGNSLSSIIGNALLGSILLNWGYSVGYFFLSFFTFMGVIMVGILLNSKPYLHNTSTNSNETVN